MRISRLIFVLASLALLHTCGRAQTAVLVLSPSPTTSIAVGTGSAGFRGDGAAATAAQLAAPSAMARDAQGNIFLADTGNHRIRRIAADGTITTVAGTGVQGFAGDEGPATNAQLDSPTGVAVLPDGILVIADTHNQRIRRVDTAGTIHTIAGTGTRGYSGDGSSAATAQLNNPMGLATGISGDLYIADAGNHCIRHLSAAGIISTVAGDGVQGTSPDATPAISAHLNTPVALTVRADGSVLIADRGNNCILILQTDGTLHLFNIASVALRRPGAVATNSLGDTLIADSGNFRVAQISSSGAGSALGSGEQGVANPSLAPSSTALGATSSVLDTTSIAASGQISVLDRDNSQLLQVTLPRLCFPDTVVATPSTPRSVLLRNGGSAVLSVVSINLPDAFTAASTSSCGSVPFQLAANTACQLDLVFTPETLGPLTALLQVAVANGLPQRVTLSGAGLRSGSQLASTVSLQTSVTLNYAGTPLSLTAAVLGSSTAAATGTVTFLDGTTELGTSRLNASAQASITLSTLTSGASTPSPPAITATSTTWVAPRPSRPSRSRLRRTSPWLPPRPRLSSTAATPAHSPLRCSLSAACSTTLSRSPWMASHRAPPSPSHPCPSPSPAIPSPSVSRSSCPSASRSSVRQHGASPCSSPCCFCSHAGVAHSFVCSPQSLSSPLALQGCGGGYLSGKSVTAQSAGATYPVTVTASCPGVTGATLTHTAALTVEVQP